MQRIRIKQILRNGELGVRALVKGWVRTRRDAKDVSFMELNDGSCLKNLQVVLVQGLLSESELKQIGTGAAVAVTGELVASPGQGQSLELRADAVELVGQADPESYPLQKKRHSDEFLRQIAHLRPRTNKYGAMFRLRSKICLAIHDFFRERGFFYLHTPIITGSDCEGAGEMFKLSAHENIQDPEDKGFFGKPGFLTVSGQLSAEAFACALGQVYTFGPTFRAECSDTARHAAEFWMVEPEMAFADLGEDMDLAEEMLKYLVGYALNECSDELELFMKYVDQGLAGQLEKVARDPFARLSYVEAIEILKKSGKKFDYAVSYGLDLQTEHERYLSEEYCRGPVIVYDYPKEIKAFYMRQNDDGRSVAAMDLLVPRIGEIIGGSAREDRSEVLVARLQELGLNIDNYWWYLDLRRFGGVPHAGFGLGFERLLMLLTGVTNIRDVTPFPRTYKHLEF